MSYGIIKHGNKFYIELNGSIPKWQTGFATVECAEHFAETHNIHSATDDHIDYSTDDVEFIVDNYKFRPEGDMWLMRNKDTLYYLIPDEYELRMNADTNGTCETFIGVDSILEKLDQISSAIIFSNYMFIDSSLRQEVIECATNSRDLTKNMIRVKSSNLWSYGINIPDARSKTGDVVIQFKGKNGGPGDIYLYEDVPINVWRRFITYPSKGAFHWKYIRNVYRYRKLTGDKRTHLPNGIN